MPARDSGRRPGRRGTGRRDTRAASTRTASNLLLLVGYSLAAAAGARLVPAWRQRRLGRFLAFEAGTACVTAGLALRRKWFLMTTNAITLVGAAAAWVVSGRRR